MDQIYANCILILFDFTDFTIFCPIIFACYEHLIINPAGKTPRLVKSYPKTQMNFAHVKLLNPFFVLQILDLFTTLLAIWQDR